MNLKVRHGGLLIADGNDTADDVGDADDGDDVLLIAAESVLIVMTT